MKRIHRFVPIVIILSFSFSLYAQYEEQKTFAYLEATFNKHDKYLQDVLVAELTHYMKMFPNSENASRSQQMLAKVYEEKRKKDEAIASYLKMFCLYPDVANVSGNTDDLRQLVANDRSYNEEKEWLFGILDQNVSARPLADSHYHYLSILVELDQSGLRDWLLDECRNFHLQFPNDSRNEQVVQWMGDTYLAKRDYREAVVMYSKFEYLFPDNPLTPTVRYKRANVVYENLRDEGKALEILNGLIADHANDPIMPDALYLRGVISSKELKKYQDAISDLRKLTDTYPDNPKVINALERMRDIYENDLKDYPSTIEVLDELVSKTKDEGKGIEALEDIASIYERRLDKYAAAAETYARIADLYPNYEKAPDRLIDAGELCERKLNDYPKAISYYQMVLDKFPGHDKAEDARKKIADAQEELNKN